MRLTILRLATPRARNAYVMIVTALLQQGCTIEETWTQGAAYFSKWLSKDEKRPYEVTVDAFRLAIPYTDNTMPTKLMLGLLVSREILDRMVRGEETSTAVEKGYERFGIHPGKEELLRQISIYEAERWRISNLKPHQMDNGAGGTIDIITLPKDVNPLDSNAVEREGTLTTKKSLMNPEPEDVQ